MAETLSWGRESDLEVLQGSLVRGEVSVGTSDTVLGLMADVTEKGFLRLCQVKGRDSCRSYLVLVGSRGSVSKFADTAGSVYFERLTSAFWPGPLTVILRSAESFQSSRLFPSGTVAVRIPAHQGLLTLLSRMDGLFSTSANLSGFPVASRFEELSPELMAKVGFVVGDPTSEKVAPCPSTIVDISGAQIRLVREGMVSKEAIEGALDTKLHL